MQQLEPRLALAVADTVAPAVRSIAAPRSQTYGAGSTLSFTVNFTEGVVVTGTPTLPIAIGDSVRQATWNGRGSGGRALVFTAAVQAGDVAPSGVSVAGPIGLAGGASIRDRAGNPLVPSAAGVFPNVRVDGVGPRVADFGPVSVVGKRVVLQVTFNEPVTVSGKPVIPFTLAGAPRQLVYASGSGRNVLSFEYKATAQEVPTIGNVVPTPAVIASGRSRIADRAGNAAASLARPTNVFLSATGIPENQPPGSVVGVLSAADDDGLRDRQTFALVGGAGSTDNASFVIDGTLLRAASSFDFETKNSHSIRVRATDQGGLFVERVFTIAVTDVAELPPNTPPTLGPMPGLPDPVSGVVDGSAGGTDADADPLSYVVAVAPAKGTLMLDAATGAFTYTPNASARHAAAAVAAAPADLNDAFSLTAVDGRGGSATAQVTVAIAPRNTAPVMSPTVGSPDPASGVVNGSVNGSDADADLLTYVISAVPAKGAVVLDAATGSFTYTPTASARHAAAAVGAAPADLSDAFTVTALDGYGGSAAVPVTVAVAARNTAPVVTSTVGSPDPASGVVNGSAGGSDADADLLTYVISAVPAKGAVVLDAANGSFTYTPTASARHAAAAVGATAADLSDAFTVTALDGYGGSAAVPVTVAVAPRNTAPVASPTVGSPDSASGVVSGSVNGSDADADLLNYAIAEVSSKGAVVLDAATGSFTYTPTAAARYAAASINASAADLADTFSLTALDGHGGATTVPVTVAVAPVNDVISLSSASIPENAAANAVVGTLGTFSPGSGISFTYTLTGGTGSTDNTAFTISGNQLRATASFDFETKNTYSIRVRSADQNGTAFERAFTVTVTNLAVEMAFVTVGDIGNSSDPATGNAYGAVNDQYQIGTYEVTIQQYSDFLNAAAQSDPYALYNSNMASDLNVAGIQRDGVSGSYTYSVIGGRGSRPITYVSWFDAARFANWMHNGQGSSSTETGAYTLEGATSGTAVAKNAGSKFSLPTENEWYKAAHYSPVKGGVGSPGYYAYATQSDTAPGNVIGSGVNQANFFNGVYSTTGSGAQDPNQNYLTDAGAFTNSASYYGTFDQSGNVTEWNDLPGSDGSSRGLRGGNWTGNQAFYVSSANVATVDPWFEGPRIGFRLARPVADPGNRAPTDIALSATSIAENAGANAVVGTLTATDPDAGTAFTYALVNGAGATDNAAFNMSGNQVRANASLDFETRSSYSIRVRAFDQGGLFTDKTFTITVTNIPVEMQFVTVGNAGAAAVAYEYGVGTYEVTNAEYATFLNAVATADAYGLYSPAMGFTARGGIARTGTSGGYAYSVKPNMGDKPVVYVNWFDVARFANWMHNGQPTGNQGASTTERGVYTLDGQVNGAAPARNPGARFAIPTQVEWNKAAYYSPVLNAGAGGVYVYATQADEAPTAVTAGTTGDGSAASAGNCANYGETADWNNQNGNVTTVGTNGRSSFYGTFDQSGNVAELTEEYDTQTESLAVLGGDWSSSDATWLLNPMSMTLSYTGVSMVGFRLVRLG